MAPLKDVEDLPDGQPSSTYEANANAGGSTSAGASGGSGQQGVSSGSQAYQLRYSNAQSFAPASGITSERASVTATPTGATGAFGQQGVSSGSPEYHATYSNPYSVGSGSSSTVGNGSSSGHQSGGDIKTYFSPQTPNAATQQNTQSIVNDPFTSCPRAQQSRYPSSQAVSSTYAGVQQYGLPILNRLSSHATEVIDDSVRIPILTEE